MRIRRALISVSDKQGVVDFARALSDLEVEILSTGGTWKVLSMAGLPVQEVADYTGYPEMITLAKDEVEKAGIPGYIFSNAGDGNFHLVMMAKKGDTKEREAFETINNRIVSKAIRLGGTATGEHGVGLGKKQFMAVEHGASLEWMRRIKDLFDPKGILNPDKVFPH